MPHIVAGEFFMAQISAMRCQELNMITHFFFFCSYMTFSAVSNSVSNVRASFG